MCEQALKRIAELQKISKVDNSEISTYAKTLENEIVLLYKTVFAEIQKMEDMIAQYGLDEIDA